MRLPCILVIQVLACLISGSVFANCENLPSDVQEYLQQKPGWSVIDIADLVDDDKELWNEYHPGLCPGIAAGNFHGNGQTEFAIALVREEKARTFEKVVVLTRTVTGMRSVVVVPPFNIKYTDVAAPIVIWTAEAGKYREWDSEREVTVPNDAFIFEKMESAARLYYVARGRFRFLQVSD